MARAFESLSGTNMNKRSTDMTWKAMFEVRYVERALNGEAPGWAVVNVHNGETMGTYRDNGYAVKQARRKYKKFIRLMEKTLMSQEDSDT